MSEHDSDDGALVTAAQRGDQRSYEILVERHLRFVRTFIALRAPVAQLVDEVAHDTFLHAYHHLSEFTPGTSLRAWLRAIAYHKLRGEVQRHAREQVHLLRFAEQVAVEEDLSAPVRDRSDHETDALHECLSGVSDEHRRLLTLKYDDDLESDDIARLLRRSAAWVRTTLFRLREVLRDCIEEKTTGGALS